MKMYFDGSVLLIRPEGRIDSENASAAENEIFSSVKTNVPKYIVIDAEKLEYISSAGLRVLLKLKKAVDNTQIVNASTEVYDIFDMTGFTEMISVRKALRSISVEGCRVLGEGAFGTTYKLSDDTIVKLYKQGVPFEDMLREKESAKAAFVSGVPTAIPFDTVKCGEQYGTVYELLNARTLGDVISEDQGNLDEYAKKAAELLKLLASTHGDKGKFFSYAEVAHKNADILNKSVEGDLFTAEELEAVHKFYDTVPERDTLIHGDFHTHNIFISDGELLLIDMADTSIGHPIFELGNMFLPFNYLSGQGDEHCMRSLGLSCSNAKDFFSKTVGYYLADMGADELSGLMELARIIGHLRMMYSALPSLSVLTADVRTKYLMGLKNDLKAMYLDRSEEMQSLVKKITALF